MPRATNEITNEHMFPPVPKHLDCLTQRPGPRGAVGSRASQVAASLGVWLYFLRYCFQMGLQAVPATDVLLFGGVFFF